MFSIYLRDSHTHMMKHRFSRTMLICLCMRGVLVEGLPIPWVKRGIDLFTLVGKGERRCNTGYFWCLLKQSVPSKTLFKMSLIPKAYVANARSFYPILVTEWPKFIASNGLLHFRPAFVGVGHLRLDTVLAESQVAPCRRETHHSFRMLLSK